MIITGPSPEVLGIPPGCDETFWDDVWRGWVSSQMGFVDEAKEHYSNADKALSQGRFNPSLSVLRHNIGVGEGSVESFEPTEDKVFSITLAPRTMFGDNGKHILGEIPEEHITKLVMAFSQDITQIISEFHSPM